MTKFTERDMSAALQMVADGISINKAAQACGINRSTLQDRIKGATTPKQAHEHRQKLSAIQERKLRDWIMVQADLGCPVSHQQVRHFANQIAVRNGFPDGVGKHWLQSFMDRNEDVKTLPGKRMDSERYNGASTEHIKAFFMLLMMLAIRIVKQKNRYNVDEVGMIEGIGLNGLFLGHKDKKALKRAYRKFLSDLASIADSSHIGKITFLYTYDKARKEAITKLNALAGWKATGLWPVNLAKVLMNPMVTQTPETPAPAVTAISPAKEKNFSLPKTPKSSVQLRRSLQAVPAAVSADSTARLLFRKIRIYFGNHNPFGAHLLDSPTRPTPQEVRVNDHTWVARLAEEFRHPLFFGAFVPYRRHALELLVELVNGCTEPEFISEVAAVSSTIAPRLVKNLPWAHDERKGARVRIWEITKHFWIELTVHSSSQVWLTAAEAVTCIISTEMFPSP
ncbi:hypothetical protein FBEOM_6870 [Fusarium beomiforme]|uniref:HTH CENPB-type domain-containing protein n=1 Tax=Fusarium beomiforme TaxID=44412 RepID=A0A9P5AIF9_9HYPO|nr:hypothetical protein FBEOM_6870 [Fusarium beomiforme]